MHAYCAIIYMYVGIYAELSFKMHMLMTIVKDWVSTTVAKENKSIGSGQKTEFKELEVNNYMYDNIPLYTFLKSWSKHYQVAYDWKP